MPQPFSGREQFRAGGSPVGPSVLDFWRWSGSNLLSNAQRGVLAEFIVGTALGCVADTVRNEWDAADLRTADGLKIEVKSSAYVQTWAQLRPSTITCDIQPTQRWDAATNEYSAERRRQADVYVFGLLAHPDRETIDPLDLDQWEFRVLPTATLDTLGPQRTASLSTLTRLGAVPVPYADLAEAVHAAAARMSDDGGVPT